MAWKFKKRNDAGKSGVVFEMEDASRLDPKGNPIKMRHLIVGRNLSRGRIKQIIKDRTREETGTEITLTDQETGR